MALLRRSPRPPVPRFARVRALPWRRILPITAGALAVVVAVPPLRTAAANATANVVLTAATPFAPSISDFDALPQTTRVLAADGSVLAELDDGERRERVRLDQLPDHVSRAVLAAEDQNFYHHAGVDLTAIARATVRSLEGNTQGGSTITQQLAKLNYAGRDRTLFRKFKEVLYARRLEEKYSKNELLERYLNQVYFGDGAYGIAAAADAFFGVAPKDLTPAQAAMLAGKIRAPEALDPRTKPDAVKRRRDQVLRNMAKQGWLDRTALQEALATPIQVVPETARSRIRKAPHFVEYVRREAMTLDALGASTEARGKRLVTGGLTIHTTLDPKAFDATVAAVQQRLGAPGDPTAALVSVKPGDGAITNLFAGLDQNRKFDVATQGRRQPGSAFKPFVYLAALEAGIDPGTRLPASSPMTFEWKGQRFDVDNYEGHGAGEMTIDDALVQSVNTVYARLGIEVGPENVVKAAEKAGIHQGIKPFPAVALGGLSEGVSPLEMAAAYATFAAKGVYATPYAITSIEAPGGEVLYHHEAQVRDAFDPRMVGVLNRPLQDVVRRGTARAAAIGRPVAGKTGTTSNYTNAWFVGFTPQLATAVWTGDPDKDTPMTAVHGVRVTGGSFPAQIFAASMKVALEGQKPLPIPTADPSSLSLHGLRPTKSPVVSTPAQPAGPTTTVVSEQTTTTEVQTNEPSPTTTAVTEPKPKPTPTTSPPTTTAPAPTTTAPSSGSGSSGGGSSSP